jgi:hypothetical protein
MEEHAKFASYDPNTRTLTMKDCRGVEHRRDKGEVGDRTSSSLLRNHAIVVSRHARLPVGA